MNNYSGATDSGRSPCSVLIRGGGPGFMREGGDTDPTRRGGLAAGVRGLAAWCLSSPGGASCLVSRSFAVGTGTLKALREHQQICLQIPLGWFHAAKAMLQRLTHKEWGAWLLDAPWSFRDNFSFSAVPILSAGGSLRCPWYSACWLLPFIF